MYNIKIYHKNKLAIALKYFDKKLKYNCNDEKFYGKCLIIQSLIKHEIFQQAAKLLKNLPQYPYLKHHMNVHIRCLQRHFYQSAKYLIVAPPNTQQITFNQTVTHTFTKSIDKSMSIPHRV